MAAAKMAAARAAGRHGADVLDDFRDEDEEENKNFFLRDSTEAVAKAQKRFQEFQVLAEVEVTFEDEVDQFLADEPEDRNSFAWYRWAVACLTESFEARMAIMVLVIINGVIIGVEADHGHRERGFFDVTEIMFVVIFFIEAAAKLFGFGLNYFKDNWNTVDFLIVVGSVVQLIVNTASSDDTDTPGLSALRLVKILRLVRLIGMMKRLATLASAFVMAMKQVAWVMVLFILILYIFAVLAEGFFNSPTINDNQNITIPPYGHCDADDDQTYSCYDPRVFRNVIQSMVSLFQIMTFDDWAPMYRPIASVYPWAWLYMGAFAPIGALGLMNLITAVFIEALMDETRDARRREDELHRATRAAKIAICYETIKSFDLNNDGRLDENEIAAVLNQLRSDADMCHMFEEVGVRIQDMQALIAVCETEHDGSTINLQQLLTMAQSMNLPTLRHFIFELKHRIYQQEVVERLQINGLAEKVQSLCDKVADIERKVSPEDFKDA